MTAVQTLPDGLDDAPQPKPEARALLEMLRKHYQPDGRPQAGIWAPEIGSSCGKRRADAIWMPTTMAGGEGLHGHEVKVSRADVLVELSDPAKSDPWGQYCTYWWLVVAHPGLIAGLDIPAAWGVMAPPSGRRTRTMTIVRPAPKLTPRDPAPGVARLAAWQMWQAHNRIAGLERRVDELDRTIDALHRANDELRATRAGGSDEHSAQVSRILSAVKRHADGRRFWREVREEVVVAAIIDATATRDAAESVRCELSSLVGQVRRVVEPFTLALNDLEAAERHSRRVEQAAIAASPLPAA